MDRLTFEPNSGDTQAAHGWKFERQYVSAKPDSASRRHSPEILDPIVDLLHTDSKTLKECCLVFKSWIPRARRHLFANIILYLDEHLESWKKTFPDPSTSPAHYTKNLTIGCLHIVTAADAEPGGYITGFSRATHLEVDNHSIISESQLATFLVPFHGFSPSLKSLYVDFTSLPSSQIFDLILSFPLLENLKVIAYYPLPSIAHNNPTGLPALIQPSSPPKFTGSLELSMRKGTEPPARRLCSLPSGIHFRRLTTTWNLWRDISMTMALVEGCSHTLESINLTCDPFGRSI